MGPSVSTLALNPSPSPQPSESEEDMMTHPMRDLLDEGRLTLKSRDRQFTTFFDLKQDYHHDFVSRVRDHVQKCAYDWADLEQSKDECKHCATSFVEEWGKMYWGTETNRQKYLMPESLDDPSCLCVYPDRKDEIVDALAILLARKAKSHMRAQQPRPSMEAVVSTPSVSTQPVQPSSAPQPAIRKENKAKRKKVDRLSESPSLSDDEPRRPVARKSTGPAPPIRPFRSIVSPDRSIPDRSKAKPQAKSQELTATPSNTSASEDTAMAASTYFLVNMSNQPNMAPTWVPFKKFPSATAFLSHMLSECTLKYWDSRAQALTFLEPEQPQVVAASVKLCWSDVEIRLRPGKDEDWMLVLSQLEKVWKESQLSKDSHFYDGFKVRVMLHVMG